MVIMKIITSTLHRMKIKLFLVGLISLLVLICFGYPYINTKTIAGTFPIDKIEIYKHTITIYPSKKTDLKDLVDIGLFYDFLPNQNFEETVNVFGKPDNIRKDKGNIYYEFWKPRARIEVVREETSTGSGINPVNITWSLRTLPKDEPINKILNSQITKYINFDNENTIILILNDSKEIRMLIDIVGGRINYISWIK